MTVHRCGLCETPHDSMRAALNCCAEQFEDDDDDRDAYDPAGIAGEQATRVLPDGGKNLCGRRTCDRESAVGFRNQHGAIRARCEKHALEDGVDGIGATRAEQILDELTLTELIDRCEGVDGTHAPPVLSRIDGIGPTTAATIAANVDESSVARAVRGGDPRGD